MAKNIGAVIREERTRMGISARELGRRAGCTGVAINYYEQNKRVPNIYIADRIMAALGTELVLGEKEEHDG
ncbi:helix-turn-helix domain-containing protein [Anaerotalea alkaliphila]|uniref:Helix-turn-helix transcriptional regulator n=1 Tax=Anaerotalea alkaliphila TaxID=2662126 RepID=A0A7X5HXM0_9FIRM|nr:helix-turn-helix transcriptional regulator [Anaerotalea alkaliphila]